MKRSNHRKKFSFPLLSSQKLYYKFLAIGGVCFCFFFLAYSITHPDLPSQENPILFYSNQQGDDLKRVFRSAIRAAKETIFLQIYGCTDTDIIQDVCKKKKETVALPLFYDPSGSGSLQKKIPEAIPLQGQGLMHKKILIIDHTLVLLGTANLTPTSLCMHDNVVVGLHHKDLAHFLEHSIENQFSFPIGQQEGTIWHLPDHRHLCLTSLLDIIHNAQSSIYLSLFTFTHPKIIEALILAKKRGVNVYVALDFYAARGASKKALQRFYEQGIPCYISLGGSKLLHHKWAIIDGSILLLGSANWTVSAFNKNDDCIFKLSPLTQKQNRYFMKIWKSIESGSTPFTNTH